MTFPIRNTSPFLGLHARARDAPHQSTDEGRSAPVHGQGTLPTSPRTRDGPHQSTDEGCSAPVHGRGTLRISPRTRDAPHQSTDEGHSAPVPGRGTLRTSTRTRDAPHQSTDAIAIAWEGDIYIERQTSRLLDRIGPVGRFVENPANGRHQLSRPMRIVGPIQI